MCYIGEHLHLNTDRCCVIVILAAHLRVTLANIQCWRFGDGGRIAIGFGRLMIVEVDS